MIARRVSGRRRECEGFVSRAAAWVFVAGWVIFWIGAFTPPWRQWMSPLIEAHSIIGRHPVAWHFINGCIAVGSLVTAAAFVLHAQATSAKPWATVAAASYGFAVAMFLVNLSFRHTVQVWAAEAVVRTGELPTGYVVWYRFAGLLFGVYGVLAYLAVAALGASLLESPHLPRWIAWGNLIGGSLLAALMLGNLPPANAPLMVHLGPGLAGLFVLLRSEQGVPLDAP